MSLGSAFARRGSIGNHQRMGGIPRPPSQSARAVGGCNDLQQSVGTIQKLCKTRCPHKQWARALGGRHPPACAPQAATTDCA